MHLTVMITSAGRRVELIQCLRQSAGELGVRLTILACDMAPEWSSACQVADDRFTVPRCLDDAFVPAMIRLVNEHRIGLIVPTIDTELPAFSAYADYFHGVGCRVAVSSVAAVGIARDKLMTAQILKGSGLPVPITLPWESCCDVKGLPLPAILKPIDGSCSKGIILVDDWSAFDFTQSLDGYIVQERLSGEELTVNCFTDVRGKLLAAVPHRRREVRAGEVCKAEVVHHPALEGAAQKINDAIPGLYGAWCFQAIDTGSQMGIFEINARFGGGYPIAHRAGAYFTRWLLEDALGQPNSDLAAWKAGVRMMRYDAAIFGESP